VFNCLEARNRSCSNKTQTGPTLTPDFPDSVMRLVKNVANGDETTIKVIGPSTSMVHDTIFCSMPNCTNQNGAEYFIDVRDTACLHVIVLLDTDVQSSRTFAFAHALNLTDITNTMRKL
jgi:hypothetical protein